MGAGEPTKKRGDGTGGRLLAPYARLRAVKGLGSLTALARTAKVAFGLKMFSSLVFPGPTGWPPALAFLIGVGQGLLGDTEKQRKKGWREAKRSLEIVMPFRNFMKDFARFMESEFSFFDFLFYTEKKENER